MFFEKYLPGLSIIPEPLKGHLKYTVFGLDEYIGKIERRDGKFVFFPDHNIYMTEEDIYKLGNYMREIQRFNREEPQS